MNLRAASRREVPDADKLLRMIVLIHSEEHLRIALALLRRTLDRCDSGIHVLVIGAERKVLCKVAQKKLDQWRPEGHDAKPPDSTQPNSKPLKTKQRGPDLKSWSVSVAPVQSDAESIRGEIERMPTQPVMLVGGKQNRELMATVFETLGNRTLWLQAPRSAAEPTLRLHEVRVKGTSVPKDASERFFRSQSRYPVEVPLESDEEGGPSLDKVLAGRIGDHALDARDLLIFPFGDPEPKDRVYRRVMRAFDEETAFGLALVHDGDDVVEIAASWIQRKWKAVAPPMARNQRLELADDLRANSKLNLEFLGLISASAMLATFGLVQNSAAVIIGAMLVAPLMTPLMGAGLAIAQGNRPLLRQAMFTVVCGFFGALVASFLFGVVYLMLDSVGIGDRSELMARTRPTTIDFGVALVGGLAASYARTRTHLSAALAGAAIAAALIPPISTAGLLIAIKVLGAPGEWPTAVGPVLLVSINILMIVIGSSFVLWSRGMSGDVTSGKHHKKAVRLIAVLTFVGLLFLLWTYHRNHPNEPVVPERQLEPT